MPQAPRPSGSASGALPSARLGLLAHRRHAARPVHDAALVPEPARVERLGRAARAELGRLAVPVVGAFGLEQVAEVLELGLGPGLGLGLVRVLDDDAPLLLALIPAAAPAVGGARLAHALGRLR